MDAEKKKSNWSAKRIIALAAIVILLGFYIAAFIAAFIGSPLASRIFTFCFGMTIAVPLFAWVAIWAIGAMKGRRTIASLDILNSNKEARREMEEALEREKNKTENSAAKKTGKPSEKDKSQRSS